MEKDDSASALEQVNQAIAECEKHVPVQEPLYSALGQLARFVNDSMREHQTMEVRLASTTEQLPDAAAQLLDINKGMEEGTHKVMELAELLLDRQDDLGKYLGALTPEALGAAPALIPEVVDPARACVEKNKELIIELLTSLSFQDLMGQRLKKIFTVFREVESRLLGMVVEFGGATGEAARGESADDNKSRDVILQELEWSKRKDTVDQDLADDILAQFGFK